MIVAAGKRAIRRIRAKLSFTRQAFRVCLRCQAHSTALPSSPDLNILFRAFAHAVDVIQGIG